MSTPNEQPPSPSQEQQLKLTAPTSIEPPQEWQVIEDPASGVPRQVNSVTGEVKIEVENDDGEVVKPKPLPTPNQQPSPTQQEVRELWLGLDVE